MTDKFLFGLGNPLLDILATVDIELLKKYGLKENDTKFAEEKHKPIYDEVVKKFVVQYVPGGATQNTIKVAQWILNRKYACTFTGCITNDNYGKILKESCDRIGVRTLYQYNEGPETTGVCACLITGHNRSLVTTLGSSGKFTVDFLSKPDIWKFIQQARIFYISSYVTTSAHDSLIKVAQHSLEHNKTFCVNLGAEFLVELFNAQVVEAIEYSDFVFGNEAEALKLSVKCQFGTTAIVEIAKRIGQMPSRKANMQRTVVITQGPDPVILFHEGEIRQYPVTKLADELIVDTTGAGDSFVGGFLAQLLNGQPIDESVRCGIWAAAIVIQRMGCTFPDECLFR